MPARIGVIKTYKLFIDGQFPRSESGRSIAVRDADGGTIAHVAHASRKDFRDAVEAARKARPGWSSRTAYNRGQILYRMAEMLQGRREEFIDALAATGTKKSSGRATSQSKSQTKSKSRRDFAREVDASIDRLIAFAGWSDKFAHVLGCRNAVASPYYNFTVPEPTGVVGVVAPDEPPLLGLLSLVAPVIVPGNVAVVIINQKHPLAAAVFGEVCATSDLPPGVINILTTRQEELLSHLAEHREVNAISAANLARDHARLLEAGSAENLKRVRVIDRAGDAWFDAGVCESPWEIEPFVEMKTIWHPSAV